MNEAKVVDIFPPSVLTMTSPRTAAQADNELNFQICLRKRKGIKFCLTFMRTPWGLLSTWGFPATTEDIL